MIGGPLHGFVSGGREAIPGPEKKGNEARWKAGSKQAGRIKVGKLLAFFNRLERLFGRNYQAVLKEKIFKEKEVKGN